MIRTTLIHFGALVASAVASLDAKGQGVPVATSQQSTPSRLVLNDEPDWNTAEQLAARGEWDTATDAYLKAERTTQKPWLRSRISARLLDVAANAKRYETVVSAYLSLVRTDPSLAANRRPALPEGDSTYARGAIEAASKMLSEPTLTDDQKQLLLSLQLDLFRVQKDDAGADRILHQLEQLATPFGGGPSGSTRRFAESKLSAARVAIDRGNHEAALTALTTARPALTDPAQQEEALYLLARSAEAKAIANKNAHDLLKDAGLAYMRVIAHFQDSGGNRRVADAWYGCAGVFERLGETKIAADLYEQAAIRYDTRPESRAARDRARRLRDGAAAVPARTND